MFLNDIYFYFFMLGSSFRQEKDSATSNSEAEIDNVQGEKKVL